MNRQEIGHLAPVLAVLLLTGCGPAATLFDSIDRLVYPPPPPGSLDSSFGGTGIVTTPIGMGIDQAYGVAIQDTGEIVVAGYAGMPGNDFAVVRHTTTGELDSTFDSDGIVTTPIGSSFDQAIGVKIQDNGRIVASGFSMGGSDYDFAVARYLDTGELDVTFSGDGKLTTAVGPGDDLAYAVSIQGDGKILVAGASHNGTNDDFAVVRYLSTGALDSGAPTPFDGEGLAITDFGASEQAYGIAIQSDGKIVVVGYSGTGLNSDFAVVRYTELGALDSTFDGDGKLITSFGTGIDQAYGVAIQGDNKIVVVGYSYNGSNYDFAVARYLDTGELDSTFGGGGKVTTPIGSGLDQAYGVAIQSDGKIVVAGFSNNGANTDFAVIRYTTTGALDTSFGSGGVVTTPLGSGTDQAYAVGIQSDGKILVAGYSSDDFAVVRYLP